MCQPHSQVASAKLFPPPYLTSSSKRFVAKKSPTNKSFRMFPVYHYRCPPTCRSLWRWRVHTSTLQGRVHIWCLVLRLPIPMNLSSFFRPLTRHAIEFRGGPTRDPKNTTLSRTTLRISLTSHRQSPPTRRFLLKRKRRTRDLAHAGSPRGQSGAVLHQLRGRTSFRNEVTQ